MFGRIVEQKLIYVVSIVSIVIEITLLLSPLIPLLSFTPPRIVYQLVTPTTTTAATAATAATTATATATAAGLHHHYDSDSYAAPGFASLIVLGPRP